MANELENLWQQSKPAQRVENTPPEDLWAQSTPVEKGYWEQYREGVGAARDQMRSPEVLGETYKFGGPQGQATVGLGETALTMGTGILSIPAAAIDMAGEKLGIREDEMPDVPLMDQQYVAYKEELEDLQSQVKRERRRLPIRGGQRRPSINVDEVNARISELQTKIANIEANDPTISERKIYTNPSFGDLQSKYIYEPRTETGKATLGVVGAALKPAADVAEYPVSAIVDYFVDDEEEARRLKEGGQAAVDAALMVAPFTPKGQAAIRKTADVAKRGVQATTETIKDTAALVTRRGRLEREMKKVQEQIDSTPIVIRTLKEQYADNPQQLSRVTERAKARQEELRTRRAEIQKQLDDISLNKTAKDLKSFQQTRDWIRQVAKDPNRPSGVRKLARQAEDFLLRHPSTGIMALIVDGLIYVGGGAPLVVSGARLGTSVMSKGMRSLGDLRKGLNEMRKSGPSGSVDLPTRQTLEEMIELLPAEERQLIRDFQKKVEAGEDYTTELDRLDDYIEGTKTEDDFLRENAEIEEYADQEAIRAQEDEMFRQREIDRAEQAEIEADYRRDNPEGVDPVAWTQLKKQEAELQKAEMEAEIAQGSGGRTATDNRSARQKLDDRMTAANARANKNDAGTEAAQKEMAELEVIRNKYDRGEIDDAGLAAIIERYEAGSKANTRPEPTRAEQKAYEDAARAEGIDVDAETPPPSGRKQTREEIMADLLRKKNKTEETSGIDAATQEALDATSPEGRGKKPPKDTLGMQSTIAERTVFKEKLAKGDLLFDEYKMKDGRSMTLEEILDSIDEGKPAAQVWDEMAFPSTVGEARIAQGKPPIDPRYDRKAEAFRDVLNDYQKKTRGN